MCRDLAKAAVSSRALSLYAVYMGGIELIFALMLVMTVLVGVARRTWVPYPIFLVLAGLGIGLIPGLPRIELKPEVVFIVFLPPILTSAAFFIPVRDIQANLRPILLLSLGLVLFTVLGLGFALHAMVPSIPLAAAFAFGAMVAPTDAIAATSVAEKLGLPQRIVTVLEGEGLVNDASGLISLRTALAALTGGFSLWSAGLEFVWVVLGGALVGLLLGWVLNRLLTRLDDTPVEVLLTFVSSFAAYLTAERLHVSGVLACVMLGLFSGRASARTMSSRTRVQAGAVWEVVIFLLNGLAFILIGLQLPAVLEGLGRYALFELIFKGLQLGLLAILLRFVWVFPATYLPRMLSRAVRERDPVPSWKFPVVISWAGMRGIVSLAAALALPENFPERNLVLFLTFCVILVTLVGQGLTLPWLVSRLKLELDNTLEREEAWARFAAAQSGLARLEQLETEDWTHAEQLEKLRKLYTVRSQRYSARYWGGREVELEERSEALDRLRRELMLSEQKTLVELRDGGTIGDTAMRRVQRELDLEDVRLNEAGAG